MSELDNETKKILNDLYNNPRYGLNSLTQFKKNVIKLHPEISAKQIKYFYDNNFVNQIFKKQHIDKSKFYKIVADPLSFQLDLTFFDKSQQKQNSGIYIYLTLIDVQSRKAFMYSVKNRTGEEIIRAFNLFLNDIKPQKVNSLTGDLEFNFNKFNELCKSLNITTYFDSAADDHFTKNNSNKLGIIDRYTRTIKQKILKYQKANNNINFNKVLPEILENYNNSDHRTLKASPNDYYEDKDKQIDLKNEFREENKEIRESIDLKIGDKVRCIIEKKIFEKEGQNFSKKIYTIKEISGNKYIIVDENDKIKAKKYKANELQKINIDTLNQPVVKKEINTKIKELKVKEKIIKELKKDDIDKKNIINTKLRNEILHDTRSKKK